MKIAVINPYARAGSYSGPNVLMERLFSALAERHEMTLVAGDRSAADGREWVSHLEQPTVFRPSHRLDQFRWAWSCGLWLARHQRSFDVIHIHGAYLFNLLAVLFPAMARARYVLLPLAGGGDLGAASTTSRIVPLRVLRRFVVSRASAGLALAPQIVTELEQWGLSPDRVFRLQNAVDTDSCRPPLVDERATLRTIVFVGSLGNRKNPFAVLRALANLQDTGFADAHAIFVGPFTDEAAKARFMSLRGDLGLGKSVELTGFRSDVVPFLHQASVFVLPSGQEGLPGALVEAMSAGLPTVVTDVGSMGETVTAAGCGFVVDEDDASLQRAITHIWTSPGQWADFSARGREYALEHFGLDLVANRYQEVLERSDRHDARH